MAEPDNVMGPFWPADWKTGWFGVKYTDYEGGPKAGHLLVSLLAARNVSEGTETTVVGTPVKVDLVDGKPYHPKATINDNGDWVMEWPTTDDPDILPELNKVQIVEVFDDGLGVTLQFDLVSADTFNDPAWPATDPTAVIIQPGVYLGSLWLEAVDPGPGEWTTQPAYIRTGDGVIFENTGRIVRIGA